jgi:dihydroxyacetone kinase-like predicted kinase
MSAAGETGEGGDVALVRAGSAVQALAALAVAEPTLPLAEDAAGMSAAAAATRSASVSLAAQSADTSAGPCLPGDALGVLDGAVAVVGAEVLWVVCRLVDRLAEGAELLTVVLGEQAPAGLADQLTEHVRRGHPHLAVSVLDGGQPFPVVLLGAE